MERLIEQIAAYQPSNEQEALDKQQMLAFLRNNPDALDRTNLTAHFSASGWIVNKARDRVLLCYHKIYDSWSWTGGHADGESDLEKVAVCEALEETGVPAKPVHPGEIFSLETLYVMGHVKRGQYVPCHLHMNLTYLLEADETIPLMIKADENSGLRWFSVENALKASTEPWMVNWIYRKLTEKMKTF